MRPSFFGNSRLALTPVTTYAAVGLAQPAHSLLLAVAEVAVHSLHQDPTKVMRTRLGYGAKAARCSGLTYRGANLA